MAHSTTVHMVALHSPDSEMETMLLKSVLSDAGIDFFVKNDTFGSLTVGPAISHYNQKTIYVAADQLEEARQLIATFLERTALPEPPSYSLGDKLRMVAEFLVFGWFLPGRRRRGDPPALHMVEGDAGETSEGAPQRRGRRPQLRLVKGGGASGATDGGPGSRRPRR